MRKHDVRKWLHAILDLLPVILIPVFMIYSHRHTIDSGSIDVPQSQVVDFNQTITLPFIDNDWSNSNSTYVFNGNDSSFTALAQYGNVFSNIDFTSYTHKYLIKCDLQLTDVSAYEKIVVRLTNDTNYFVRASSTLNWQTLNFIVIPSQSNRIQILDQRTEDFSVIYFRNVMAFDLTQMFGVGNEPTIDKFNEIFTAQYYDYTLSKRVLANNVTSITYNDTDIMSQFTYQLYNSVYKYFNMGNVFHLNEVYDWFNLNIFNGQAPIYIFIVYQIVLYELIMDLLMLLYALFMWFIDMIEKLMEKPLNSIK